MDEVTKQPPLTFGFTRWARVWLLIAREHGLRTALRSARIQLEEKLERRGPHTVFRLIRWWYALGIGFGVLLTTIAPTPRGPGPIEVGRLAAFTAICGLGVACALRSLAMLLASFSTNLLIHRFTVTLRPTLIRAGVIALIGFAAALFPWPSSGWVALSLAVIAWTVWPILLHAVIAARAPRHITHRLLPLDRLMAMSTRKLPPEAKRMVALHEAGHAVFFGLGDRVPEDLFAWMDDEIPAVEDIASGATAAVGGAVSAFTSLTEKSIALDMRQEELLAVLGMLCGGAAAERMVTGSASAGMVMDVASFEPKARLYLSLFPDSRWPYLLHPAGEIEAQSNAASLGRFREHVEACSGEFVGANRSQLEAVAAALQEKGELDVEDLRHLLADVTPAGGFQRFVWPRDVPAMAYVRETQPALET